MPIEFVTPEEQRKFMASSKQVNEAHLALRNAYAAQEGVWSEIRDRHADNTRKLHAENETLEKQIAWLASMAARLHADTLTRAGIDPDKTCTPEYWMQRSHEAVEGGE